MDFDLPEELAELQATVRRLAQDKVKPRAREIDDSGEYPQDLFEIFRDAGLLGLCIPEAYGGSGAGTAFIVERSWDGVDVGSTDRKMGVRGVDTGELLLNEVHVPAENVIGEVGGFQLAMQGLNSMRPIVAARGIGLAEGALMYATEYVQERPAFGQTIADFQGIQWEIAKLATEIEAARLLTYRAAVMSDA